MSEFKNLPSGWKVVRLGDVFDFLKTYTNSRESLNDYDEISYIHYGEIHKKYKFYLDFCVASLPKIHQSKLGDKPEFIKNGDLVIADASEDYIDIAKSVEIKNLEHKAVAGLHTFLLRDKGDYFTDGYKGYILYEPWVAKELKKKATGISVLGISKSNLLNLKIKLPPLDEQKKIAEILSTWDEAINLTINLIENKKQFKKALMQNLLTAKINWHTTTLGNAGEIITGSTPSTTNEKFWNGDITWITPTDIGDKKDIFTGERSITQDGLKATRELPANSLLVTCIASIGKNAVLKVKGSCNQQINALIPNKNFNVDFLYYLLEFEKERLKNLAGITATLIISKALFSKFEISFPDITEQQKIAEVLTACDDEINLLNLKLENLKKQKQGLMQKLLSGKVRVK